MNSDLTSELKITGWARFMYLAMSYLKQAPIVRRFLEKKRPEMNLILEATDFKPPVLIKFHDGTLDPYPVTDEFAADKSKWDAKLIANSETIVKYLIGRLGLFGPILTGKIKTKGLLKLLKLIGFLKALAKYYSGNRVFAFSVYKRLYEDSPEMIVEPPSEKSK